MDLELFESICTDIETAKVGLEKLCRDRGISRTPFYNFKDSNEEHKNRYVRAREKQLDFLQDLLIELSFDNTNDKEVIDKVNIGGNAIQRNRLQIDTIKFLLAKLRANLFGNKIEIDNKHSLNIPKVPDIGSRE